MLFDILAESDDELILFLLRLLCWRFCLFHLFLFLIGEESLQAQTVLQQIVDAGEQHIGRERFGDIGVGPALITLHLMLAQGTGREQDDGDMRGGDVILDTLTELQTVHHRHHHVAHNQVGHNLIGQLKTLLPVFGFVHLVAVL